ncbi:MAG TPA: thioesterase family protein [Dermatophilaceae bacterium]|nr:thioesterase family protein [Dermatophilaceae bacterium]
MSEFDTAMAVEAEDGSGARAVLGAGWVIGAAVNGGVLMALGAVALRRAVERAGGHGDPLVLSAYFLSAAQAGPVRLRTEVLRTGRSMSTGQVSLLQDVDGRPVERVRALATFGDVDAQSEPVWLAAEPPDLPGPDRCVAAGRESSPFAGPISLLDRLDIRLDPATVGWAGGRPSGRGEVRAWVRFADGREPDLTSLIFFLDALPPVTFDLGATGWAPTIELTGHVRGRPAPGWLLVAVSTRNVIGGLLEEDATVWDSRGRVVAQARQLAGVRMPSRPVTASAAGAAS